MLQFVQEIARRPCEAAAFYDETSMEPKCLDPNYNEMSELPEGQALQLCDPCRARKVLRTCPGCWMDPTDHEYEACPEWSAA